MEKYKNKTVISWKDYLIAVDKMLRIKLAQARQRSWIFYFILFLQMSSILEKNSLFMSVCLHCESKNI